MRRQKNEHDVIRRGWTVVMKRLNGSEFIAYKDPPNDVLNHAFHPTRAAAREQLRGLRLHRMKGYVSRATVTLRKER